MSRTSVLLCLGFLITFSACGDDDNNGVCEVGDVQTCECTGLPTGIAICGLDSSDWLDCDCPPAPTNGPPVTVGNLMWQTTLGPSLAPSAATSYCDGYTESGFSDWRLPLREEFETFFSDCADIGNGFIRCAGACNNTAFCNAVADTWYRTATTLGSGKHYVVHTGNAFIVPIDASYSVSTICVRDAP